MVLFALTKQGLADLLQWAPSGRASLWVNHGVLEESDLTRLRAEGFNLTNFTSWLDPNDESEIRGAVETIREHHPDETMYVELSCR